MTAGSTPLIAVTIIGGRKQRAGIYETIHYVFYVRKPDLSFKQSWSIISSHYPRAEQTNRRTGSRYVDPITPRKRPPRGDMMRIIINLAILAIAGIMIWKGIKLLESGEKPGEGG